MKQYEDVMKSLNLSREQILNQTQKEEKIGSFVYRCDTGEGWWSDETYRLFNVKKSAIVSMDLLFSVIDGEDEQMVREAYKMIDVKKHFDMIYAVPAGGKKRWLRQRGKLYKNNREAIPYIAGSLCDITGIKEEQDAMLVKNEELTTVNRYLSQSIARGDISSITTNVKKVLNKTMNAALSSVFLIRDEKLVLVRTKDMKEPEAMRKQPEKEWIAFQAAIAGVTVECGIEEYPNEACRKALQEIGCQRIIAVPVKEKGTIIAVVSVASRQAKAFSKAQYKFCKIVCDSLAAQLHNVMKYHKLEEELSERICTETNIDVIFSESVDFICMIDKEGRFTRVNPSFISRMGYSHEELCGQRMVYFVHPHDREEVKRMIKELPKIGVINDFKNRCVCKNGEEISMAINAKYSQETEIIIAVARDITNQVEAEARTLALEKSVALEKLKGEFFANLSHEFKTPLNIIISSLDLIKLKLCKENEEIYEKEYTKFISYAYQNCYKLLRLTTNLLDSTKIDNQFLKAQFGICKLVGLLEEITKSAEIYADARGILLSFHSEVNHNADICCDIDQVDRILLNLISNSIKNTPTGGEIRVNFSEDEDFYIVTVKDSGVGIPEEALPHIFDRFHFTDKGPMANHDGSGIGLSIVKSLVEMHRGQISVESKIGAGSRFVFSISKRLNPDKRLQEQLSNGMNYDYEARQSRVKMELSNIG